jgi:hypothetical protein
LAVLERHEAIQEVLFDVSGILRLVHEFPMLGEELISAHSLFGFFLETAANEISEFDRPVLMFG